MAHLGETEPELEERMEVRSAVRGDLGDTVVGQRRRVEVEEERVAKLGVGVLREHSVSRP